MPLQNKLRQRRVGRQQIIANKVGQRRPMVLRVDPALGYTDAVVAVVGKQPNRASTVAANRFTDKFADGNIDSKLLLQLAAQAGFRRLARGDLAARKFPTAKVIVLAPGNENRSSLDQDSRVTSIIPGR